MDDVKNKILKLMSKPFVRNVIILATGTAAAQVVSLLLAPIITRLYGPDVYGLMGVFLAIVGIIAPISALTYPIAIVLPESDKEAKRLGRLSLMIAAIIAILTSVVLFLFHHQLVTIFNLEKIAPYLYLLPIVIISAGFQQVVEQWLIRTKEFAITAKVTFFHALITQGSKVGFGFFYPFASVLIVITTLSIGIKALLLGIFSMKINFKSRDQYVEKKALSYLELAKKHKDFPLFRAPEVFLSATSQNIPIIMLTAFFGPAAAGFYSIVKTGLSLPTQLISKSVGDVFYPRISEAKNNGENLTSLMKKAIISLAAVGIVPYLFIIFFGPWIFSFVFGEDWTRAGEYARWIALWSFFGFLNKPCVMAFPVLSLQAFHLVFSIIMLISRILVLALGYYLYKSDLVAIIFLGISGAVLNILLIFITLHRSRKFDQEKI
jgi:O-antigen/teichoic acid export membrane protein